MMSHPGHHMRPLLRDHKSRHMRPHLPGHGRRRMVPPLVALCMMLFHVGVATCALCALHRIAGALRLQARMTALENHAGIYTDEERERLVHAIKKGSLGCV